MLDRWAPDCRAARTAVHGARVVGGLCRGGPRRGATGNCATHGAPRSAYRRAVAQAFEPGAALTIWTPIVATVLNVVLSKSLRRLPDVEAAQARRGECGSRTEPVAVGLADPISGDVGGRVPWKKNVAFDGRRSTNRDSGSGGAPRGGGNRGMSNFCERHKKNERERVGDASSLCPRFVKNLVVVLDCPQPAESTRRARNRTPRRLETISSRPRS